jgi:4-hydroxybenzoate polyprenyltransferase
MISARPVSTEQLQGSESHETPLFVDLDGTLLLSDSFHESLCSLAATRPADLLKLPAWVLRGKAYAKSRAAAAALPDVATLPYNEELLAYLREQKLAGRKLYLATAANERIAAAIVQHLGLFDGVVASDDTHNAAGSAKLDAIRAVIGSEHFCYAGNAQVDLGVWKGASAAIVVDASDRLATEAAALTRIERRFQTQAHGLRTYLRGIRVTQWSKNLLVLLPLLPALELLQPQSVLHVVLAFIAFSFCGSSIYVMNDLLDLPSDRVHPRKRLRPFASGAVPIAHGVALSALLFVMGIAVAATVGLLFLAVVLTYLTITTAYSMRLKRVAMVDTLVLAGLYTIRIIGGAVAAGLSLSFWILAFSMFLFLSLAMVKRHAELFDLNARGKNSTPGRGYQATDLPFVQSLGITTGMIAVLVLGLYLNEPVASANFGRPEVLWLLCPVLLYWICRVWLRTSRGRMHDDPVVFALTDRVSRVLVLIGAILVVIAR